MAYIGNQTSTAFTSMAKQDITGDGGASYTLTHAVANAQEIEVYVNNVRQEPGVAYTVSGTALTMTGNVASTDDFYVVFQGKAVQTANHPSTQPLSATTGTFSGDLTVGDSHTIGDDANDNLQIKSSSGENIKYDSVGGTHLFLANGSEKVRFQSGGGISFNGDTAAANALDDYEEGTFTPSPTVGTVSLADAAYTKIGRKVTVTFNVFNFSDRSSTSHIEFTNLPFTSDSSIGSTANAGMHRYVNAGDALAFYIPRNQTKIQLFSLNSGSNWTPTQYAHLNNSNSDIYVHLTYFAT